MINTKNNVDYTNVSSEDDFCDNCRHYISGTCTKTSTKQEPDTWCGSWEKKLRLKDAIEKLEAANFEITSMSGYYYANQEDSIIVWNVNNSNECSDFSYCTDSAIEPDHGLSLDTALRYYEETHRV